ncbi:MAG TPA: tryptophan halogenase family protein [Steroidobacteraceae bacterium]
MPDDRIRSIVIVGAGTAGWLAAAALARRLRPDFCELRLIATPEHPAAVSEAALPSFHRLNRLLGIDERDLMQRTSATFRLGTQFIDWNRVGQSYFHCFGSIGAKLEAVSFHHHWIRLHRAGRGGALEDYSAAAVCSRQGRFAPPVADRHSVLSRYSYGYHFHARALAAYLRGFAQAHGVTAIERDVRAVRLRAEDGFVDALELEDGTAIRADLYIDCRGAGGAPPAAAPPLAPLDWSHWLPCDRAVAVACARSADPPPYAQATAGSFGWQWRVPLQQCLDCGYAYSSRLIADEAAAAELLSALPGQALGPPRQLRFVPGRPAHFWDRNWLRLPGNTLEPLEGTGLHLVQTGIMRLLNLFPVRRFSADALEEYNRLTVAEYERIRDFLILHYKATTRADSPLWQHCRQMPVPDTLRARIELFETCGRISLLEEEHFGEESWLSLLIGQGIEPGDYDPLADELDTEAAHAALAFLRSKIRDAVELLPPHAAYIAQQCPAHFLGAP